MTDNEDDTQHLQIGVPADDKNFVRRECPNCGLEFKTKGDEASRQDELAAWVSRTLGEAGVLDSKDPSPVETDKTSCPYCGHTAEGQDFTHNELVTYIRRLAHRELIEPMLNQMFRNLSDSLRSSKYLKVTVSGSSSRSPRPLIGPEPNDQVAIVCLACNARFKVDEAWRGTVICPYCRTELQPH